MPEGKSAWPLLLAPHWWGHDMPHRQQHINLKRVFLVVLRRASPRNLVLHVGRHPPVGL